MSTILAKTVVARAAKTLQDETHVQWLEGELLDYLNDGQRHIVMVKRDAYTKNEAVQLITGTKQQIPAAGVSLVRVVRNMGTNGTTPGRVITKADMHVLDATNRNWHTDTANASSDHWLQDPEDQRFFYVYPQQPNANQGYVEMIYSAAPADATINGVNGGGSDSAITLDDIYFDPLYFYILAKAYSKQSQTYNGEKSANYYGMMLQSLGLKGQTEARQ